MQMYFNASLGYGTGRLGVTWLISLSLAILPEWSVYAALPLSQQTALVDLYNSTNGAGWTNRSNWLTAPDPCTWYGVTCDVTRTTVMNLDLHDNNLTGHLPVSLASMTDLRILDLNSNHLSGTIPAELGNMTRLEKLDLSGPFREPSQLSGTIPAQLGEASSLVYLDLSFNQLSGTIPAELANLNRLENLYLIANHLSGTIPPQLGGILSMRYLYLYSNNLSGPIPRDLGRLANLRDLYLSANQLSGDIPSALVTLTALSTGATDIRWNALSSYDGGLISFLNTKQVTGDWESTQTVAPTNVTARNGTATTVTVGWTPIAYIGDSGFYQVWHSTTSGGPYVKFGTTTQDKISSSLTVTDLTPGLQYYFVVTTTTLPHSSTTVIPSNNRNTVTSDFSAEVSAATLGPRRRRAVRHQ